MQCAVDQRDEGVQRGAVAFPDAVEEERDIGFQWNLPSRGGGAWVRNPQLAREAARFIQVAHRMLHGRIAADQHRGNL